MSSQEDARNMALLFFMDHLMQKSGSRTIHDLSCQFGARGFTPEMREAVGTTQEGLQDFLAQYPSLFKLEGDSVSINAYGDLGLGGSKASPLLQHISLKDRDYDAEAVDFFEQKLKKFGPELQIKSLLGHRSQAAPEVRLVSGRHVKDFSDFLQQHSRHFIVEGDRVRLAKMPEPTEPEADTDGSGLPLAGARAKQAAVEYLKDVLEDQDGFPLPMENLYQRFCGRFSHTVRQEVATNPKELLQFLKLNRTLFFIRSNKVSLVKNRSEDGSPDETPPPSGASSDNGVVEDNYLERLVVVKALKPAQTAVQDIVSAGLQQTERPVVSVDFKIVSLGPQGQEFLVLVCLGTVGGNLYIFDVAHSDSILLESGLKDLLESSEWTKVIHDCKRISAILYDQYGVRLQQVFDTQIANVVLQHQKTGKPIHEIRAISFFHLQRLYYPESLMQSDVNPRKVHKPDSGFWSQRPLTEELMRMAVEEVRLMVPHIFNTMDSSLREENRKFFQEMCDEQINFNIEKEEVKQSRLERKEKYTMDVISDKLTQDPSGFSLSSREKKLLNHLDRERNPAAEDEMIPSEIVPTEEKLIQNNGGGCFCTCGCHSSDIKETKLDWEGKGRDHGKKMVDSASQTLSTGAITMTKIYYET